ncbi:MAG: YggS family pyridoxal phosphate-dependent enzyme [Caldilinea sp.]|nr:YggS family pyridoxal phosphate-dependent enzyme [Caldilineaceae bacterium]MCB9118150.1 YggS family pyridoxal phosphate-dependent enzyme [Caldilineaceae bacterium]MCB9123318.1 YggS family pyridoxal phosphate-dependent enzyme [Caldilineaceae bacterium]MCO5208313.1 YggS family pyridoxal phosphate-dependent enzyme [Caldilinea sp.]MCW5844967.1 YggS family pyridoxal phosphate-dependent enzyme [Caldilinea sp.]
MIQDRVRTAEIAANLADVRTRIGAAAERSGRRPDDVLLVAVSKTHPIEDIVAAMAAGQRDFGENRLEELWTKVEQARSLHLDAIRWHMIGNIQSRKTRDAVGPFVLIHSIDRAKIAARLSRDAEAAGNVMKVLVEVNVSGEASKHGFTPDELLAQAGELLALPGIDVAGLMTMAPFEAEPEATRPVFRALRSLRERLADAYPAGDWNELSMGMTNDFEVAIEEGATIVRIGSAIFGSRNG